METIKMKKQYSRRNFIRSGILGAASASVAPFFPQGIRANILFPNKDIVFKPVQHRYSPPLNWAYASDEHGDAFHSPIHVAGDGVVIPEAMGGRKFAVNARWYVEGFGYIWLAADNEGELFTRSDMPSNLLLNYEFARSRIARNRSVLERYQREGVAFSTVVRHLVALSEELLDDASGKLPNSDEAGLLSDKCLRYALHAGEKMELERARHAIQRMHRRDDVYFGCETRQYVWARSEKFMERFAEVFNFATITHYVWDSWYELFEPEEGMYNWGVKDNIVNWLKRENITIQGRPLFWFHPMVTPGWLKNKNFEELKKYVENHTRNVVGHYGDDVLQWEVVNEYHDWGNIHNHTPEQITEIVRLACDKTKEVNPKVLRILNNTALWAEYAAVGWKAGTREPADRPMRTPRKFIQDLIEAGVDFDVIGLQIYFPQRDLSDIVRKLETFDTFGKPIYITEIGASSGPTPDTVFNQQMGIPDQPYAWHRHWDEDLQATWMEQVYTLYYSRPNIHAINWYDFADFRPFITNGGLIREDSSPKTSFHRLKALLKQWDQLPK
jgi:endo-1,4-beta-xylanase